MRADRLRGPGSCSPHRAGFLLSLASAAGVCGPAAAQPGAAADGVPPFTVSAEGASFRLRLSWPRSAEDMPAVRMAADPLRLVLSVPARALALEARVPSLFPQAAPVRSLSVEVAGDEGLIVLALRRPVRYEMSQVGAAWVLELQPGAPSETASTAAPIAAATPSASTATSATTTATVSKLPPPQSPLIAPALPGNTTRAETMLLDVTVNGQRLREIVQAQRTPDGRLLLPLDAWTEARLKPPATGTTPMSDGSPGYALDAVPGLVYTVDGRRQTLAVTAPAQAFAGQSLDSGASGRQAPPPPEPGFIVNYDASATVQTQGARTAGATVEGIFFNRLGSFANSVIVSDTRGMRQARRLGTTWQTDLPQRMETLILGDAISTPGAWSRPVRFAGLRWGRDFGLSPGFVTVPQPTLAGSAAVPSTVDVLINNQQRLSRQVQPGPFELGDVPVMSGVGEVNLVVRDLLGRETILRQSYYVSPRLLAAGLDDYAVEGGRLRTGYGTDADSYGDPFAALTWRRGLTPSVTGEVRAELEPQRRAVGVEFAGLLATWAIARASIAGSSSGAESGSRMLLGIERQADSFSGSLQWERFDAGYTQLAQAAGELRPRQRLLANVGGRLFGPVSGSVSYTRQVNWNAVPADLLALSLSVPLPQRFSLSAFYSRDLTGMGGWRGGVILTRPLGDGVFATASTGAGSAGRGFSDVQVASTTPAGPGVGWRIGASDNPARVLNGGVSLNTLATEATADFESDRQGASALRLGAAGSLGWLGGMSFATRPIGHGAFAVVRVGDLEGVPVLRSHQLVAQTNGAGLAFVPGLLPYQANLLEIDPGEMSLDAEINATSMDVTPYARSGALVDFDVRRTVGALVELVQEDGSAVPIGAQARLLVAGGGDASFTVARRGEVYLTGLAPANRIEVRWPGKQCGAAFDMPKGAQALPRIGPLICRAEARP